MDTTIAVAGPTGDGTFAVAVDTGDKTLPGAVDTGDGTFAVAVDTGDHKGSVGTLRVAPTVVLDPVVETAPRFYATAQPPANPGPPYAPTPAEARGHSDG